jgi:hypothetical protein
MAMGNVAALERMFWFDDQARRKRYPNATKLAERFELSPKTAQRCIDAMRDRFGAPLEYHASQKGYHYRDTSFALPHFQVSQEEVLAILLARKLLFSTSGGFISRYRGAETVRARARKCVSVKNTLRLALWHSTGGRIHDPVGAAHRREKLGSAECAVSYVRVGARRVP